MRYYVYVSETKVDQLYAQIPPRLRDRLATKLTIDLKLIKGEFEGRQPQESLFSKLDIVRSYLNDEELIGTIYQPKTFFGGELQLSWGPYEDPRSKAEFVYFGGQTNDTVVGLGGSMKHVIGAAGSAYPTSHSLSAYLVSALKATTEKPTAARDEVDFEKALEESRSSLRGGFRETPIDRGKELALRSVVLASEDMDGPWEPMEFVAKRLIAGAWGPRTVILGTPLYVAMAQ
jgi:hypothetical protein